MKYEINNTRLAATLTEVNMEASVVGQAPLEVVVGGCAHIDVGAVANYIKSGTAEIEALVETAEEYKTRAENSATLAVTSATTAANAQNAAVEANTAAQTAKTDAESACQTANSQRQLAEQYATAAGQSAVAAAASASAAANMADKDLSNLTTTGEAKFTAKQDALTFDAYPVSASTNPVTSGGVYNAVSSKINEMYYSPNIVYNTVPTSTITENIMRICSHYTDMPSQSKTIFLLQLLQPNTMGSYVRWGLASNYNSNGPLLGLQCDKDFVNAYPFAATPSETTGTAGNNIATTGWVNTVGNNVVHLSGAETIGGEKTFSAETTFNDKIKGELLGKITGIMPNFTKGTNPSSSQYCGLLLCNDKTNDSTWQNTRLGVVEVSVDTSGSTSLYFAAYQNTAGSGNNSMIQVKYYGNGTKSVEPSVDNSTYLGVSGKRWKQLYAGTTTISTSDERLKQGIEKVPDAVLDAWGEVEFYRYKFNDAVEEKGFERARYHTGIIAQRIERVFAARGLNAFEYGLFCYDEWEAQEAQNDKDGNEIIPAVAAGNRYSLRYEECLCMEAAYQRRRADRIEARLAALEARE